QNMLSIVNRSITLRHLKKMGHADAKKIEIEWHETYLLLNETVSQLSEERDKLANVNEFTFKMGKAAERARVNTMAFLKSIHFKIIVAVAALLFIIWGIPAFGIYDYNKLRTMKGIGEPYTAFLDFKRSKLKMAAPYSSLEKFKAEMLDASKFPSGYVLRDSPFTKEQVASLFRGWLQVDGVDAPQFILSSAGYTVYTLETPTGQGTLNISAFYWFDPGPAAKVALAFEFANKDSLNNLQRENTLFYDNNVLVVISSGTSTQRAVAKRDIFKK
ncbi:hypothetical protein HZA57_06790, partial [Candidatus Poribacteria bacterium]|nr:hypothetical protein [Candidatus Poribacteria bacterium]